MALQLKVPRREPTVPCAPTDAKVVAVLQSAALISVLDQLELEIVTDKAREKLLQGTLEDRALRLRGRRHSSTLAASDSGGKPHQRLPSKVARVSPAASGFASAWCLARTPYP